MIVANGKISPGMITIRLARHMMATRFELVLSDAGDFDTESSLRAVGEEALNEIAVIESRLSYYSPTSELSGLNRDAGTADVKLAPDVFELLVLARTLFERTEGAFDPTVRPLMECWSLAGDSDGPGVLPSTDQINRALTMTGMHSVQLDAKNNTVRFTRAGISIDLGGIAKGFAIQRATEFLRDSGIGSALLHGGTSTVSVIGDDRDGVPWKIGIADGLHVLATVELSDQCLSVSAQSGKMRVIDGVQYGHVVDPRSGRPVSVNAVAACVCKSATQSDALSTAALVLGPGSNLESIPDVGIAVWATGDPPRLSSVSGLPTFQPR